MRRHVTHVSCSSSSPFPLLFGLSLLIHPAAATATAVGAQEPTIASENSAVSDGDGVRRWMTGSASRAARIYGSRTITLQELIYGAAPAGGRPAQQADAPKGHVATGGDGHDDDGDLLFRSTEGLSNPKRGLGGRWGSVGGALAAKASSPVGAVEHSHLSDPRYLEMSCASLPPGQTCPAARRRHQQHRHDSRPAHAGHACTLGGQGGCSSSPRAHVARFGAECAFPLLRSPLFPSTALLPCTSPAQYRERAVRNRFVTGDWSASAAQGTDMPEDPRSAAAQQLTHVRALASRIMLAQPERDS